MKVPAHITSQTNNSNRTMQKNIVANQFDDADESSVEYQWDRLVPNHITPNHIPSHVPSYQSGSSYHQQLVSQHLLLQNPTPFVNTYGSCYKNPNIRDAMSVVSSDSNDEKQPITTSLSHKTIDVKLGNSSVSDDSSVENDDTPSIPSDVTENDVLCGRGKGANNFVGNRRFRDIVMRYRALYSNCARRSDKRAICNRIVEAVHARGGRFLTRNSKKGGWTTLEQEKILVKVSQALREGVAKWNKVSQKYEEAKAQQAQQAARTTNPGVAFLAEISSIHSASHSMIRPNVLR